MSGRHRDESGERGPEAEEVVPLRAEAGGAGFARRLRANGVMALLIGGVAVPSVLGGVVAVATRGGGDAGARPPAQVTKRDVAPTPAAPRPRVYPTYGEYVPPPRVVATFTAKAPTPHGTPSPTATPTPEFSCPPEWSRNPWLRRWCRMHGFDTDVP
ncbi:MAG TPA: hypothetical protein VE465_08565 [Streptosporangiaceae bacterium]|nr:hypothetical protein [Streptosporangiaceae bacterium]